MQTKEILNYVYNNCTRYDTLRLMLNELTEPKTGHWILTDDDCVYCSECEDSYYARPIDASWYYCPHCGAKMEDKA